MFHRGAEGSCPVSDRRTLSRKRRAAGLRVYRLALDEVMVEDPSPKQMIEEFPAKLDWLLRFLEQVRSVTREA